jgi:ketosteroid isomerase-like protein
MGSHENADVVRRGYEAFNAADMEALTEIFDESASWHTPGRSPLAGDHEGRDAAFAQFRRYGGQTGGTFKATLQHLLTSDDGSVVGVDHNSGERDGKHLDVGWCIVFEVKDGRITDGREHFYDLDAWDAFAGLPAWVGDRAQRSRRRNRARGHPALAS